VSGVNQARALTRIGPHYTRTHALRGLG